jgi:hypothetical protein
MKIKKYRIIRDGYSGYEVQVWRIWFPFWIQCGITNTHHTIDEAKKAIGIYRGDVVYSE